jgi:hypothetical protein
MPNRGMNQEQQRKRRNPTQTTPDDDEAQEADVTGAVTAESSRQRGSQRAADTEDTDIEGEDSAMEEDDLDDADDADDDEEPMGGRV